MQFLIDLRSDKELREAVDELITNRVEYAVKGQIKEIVQNLTSSKTAFGKSISDLVKEHVDRTLRTMDLRTEMNKCVREIVREKIEEKLVLPDAIVVKMQSVIETKKDSK